MTIWNTVLNRHPHHAKLPFILPFTIKNYLNFKSPSLLNYRVYCTDETLQHKMFTSKVITLPTLHSSYKIKLVSINYIHFLIMHCRMKVLVSLRKKEVLKARKVLVRESFALQTIGYRLLEKLLPRQDDISNNQANQSINAINSKQSITIHNCTPTDCLLTVPTSCLKKILLVTSHGHWW